MIHQERPPFRMALTALVAATVIHTVGCTAPEAQTAEGLADLAATFMRDLVLQVIAAWLL